LDPAADRDWSGALRAGDFERAWRISDRSLLDYCASGAIKHSGERHQQRIWRGEALAGQRVLVRCYHGLGDTIQFVRFARPLRALARRLVLWCQPELIPLLRRVDGIDALLPLHDGTPEVDYDVDIEIMELAHALRASPEMIVRGVPYLRPGSAAGLRTDASDGTLSVGLVWQAGGWDQRRAVPARALGRLGALSGITLYSLQLGAGRNMAATIPAKDIAAPDLETLAATIMGLDLVITVDTMVAHLAGALGANVWTMLHANCDWRWPTAGRSTIWYPTMRLFHQARPGDWDSVIADVAEAVKAFGAGDRAQIGAKLQGSASLR